LPNGALASWLRIALWIDSPPQTLTLFPSFSHLVSFYQQHVRCVESYESAYA
jgi:hypothetical protein